jgi:hypothetical protein
MARQPEKERTADEILANLRPPEPWSYQDDLAEIRRRRKRRDRQRRRERLYHALKQTKAG